MKRLATVLVLGLAALTATCSDMESPGAPTAEIDAPEPPVRRGTAPTVPTVGPIDARTPTRDARYSWSTRLYRELVSDAYERSVGWGRAYMLRDPATIRISVFRGDVDGRCQIGRTVRDLNGGSISYQSIISRNARHLIENATGQPWREKTYATANPALAAQISNDPGYITIGFVSNPAQCDSSRAIACAQVGSRPGGIKLKLDHSCRVQVYNSTQFATVFAHELGHSLGFFHVSDNRWVMRTTAGSASEGARYHGQEAQHMQLASRYAREGSEQMGYGVDAPVAIQHGGRGVGIFGTGGVWVE